MLFKVFDLRIFFFFVVVGRIRGKFFLLFLFFEVIFSISYVFRRFIGVELILEGIKCGLFEKRLDLVIYWVI